MNTLTRKVLRQLAGLEGQSVTSLYMPVCVGADVRQNRTRLRNLIRDASEIMLAREIGRPEVQSMSDAARELLDASDLWPPHSRGLAVFIARGSMRAIPLPFECDEACVVDRYAYLLPLVVWVASNEPYFLLAVSQNSVRLFQGTSSELEQLQVPNMPANRIEALHFDPRQGTVQIHTGQPQFAGKEGVVFHGQGGEVDVAKEEITEYFRVIDRAVCDELRDRSETLVFAGVDYLFPIYQAVNHYANLADSSVTGNPDMLTSNELRQRALCIIETSLESRRQAAVKKYWDGAAHSLTTNQLEHVLAAAHAGAIETLFVPLKRSMIGTFDPTTSVVRCDNVPLPDSQDLLNLAVTLALRTDASIEVDSSGYIPGGGVIAAVLRYPFTPGAALEFQVSGNS